MVIEALVARIASELGGNAAAARAVLAGRSDSLTSAERLAVGRLLAKVRVVDPAAGAGVFLICAAEELRRLARNLAATGVRGLADMGTLAGALTHCHGFELHADAAEIARSVVALSTGIPIANDELGIVQHRNVLVDGLHHPAAPDGWDIVVMNPPYVGEKFLRARLGDDFRDALKKRDGFAGDLIEHFLLRALDGLRENGVVSAIVSDTLLTMDASAALRRTILERTALASIAWTRPFKKVAVNAVILTLALSGSTKPTTAEYLVGNTGSDLISARRKRLSIAAFHQLPNKPLFRPSSSARAIARCWAQVEDLDGLWRSVANRGGASKSHAGQMPSRPGDWTLLGAVTRSGQGLATGDDRRFIGVVAGSPEAQRAIRRQSRMLAAIRSESRFCDQWIAVRKSMGEGASLEDALLALLDVRGSSGNDLPERKPFRLVQLDEVRTTSLTPEERTLGIASGPTWVPYETSDRSTSRGGAAWVRSNPALIDWSRESVALLRARRVAGPQKPVLRNEDMWFRGGVTHNRVASYLRARIAPPGAIFSSESPMYISTVDWLDEFVLVALLNAPVIEFALKTFLSSRNHLEVGHLRRLPIPFLEPSARSALGKIGRAAVQAATDGGETRLDAITDELDAFTRELYGIRPGAALALQR
jgi:methylase of polypeptide subunit release factors